MRVGLDGGIFRNARAGIARYVEQMLIRMMVLAPDWEFRLYSPVPVEPGLPDGNWRLIADRTWIGRPATIWLQVCLPEILARDRIDVFWGQNHMLPLRLQHRCARALTIHDLTPELCPETMHPPTRLAARFLGGRAARAADCLIMDSMATARLAELFYGVDPARSRVISLGSGLETGQAGDEPGPGESAATEFQLPSENLLTVGTLEPRKDHETLFRALESLPDAPPLVVAGTVGWRCRRILSRVRKLERMGRVYYTGRVGDIQLRRLYRDARLMVCSSRYEGFGLPVLEAMKLGCPVVSSWSSSLPEVGGSAARYFRVGDHQGLARLLTRLLKNPEELERMRQAGFRQAARFSFSDAAAQMLGCFRELVGRRD